MVLATVHGHKEIIIPQILIYIARQFESSYRRQCALYVQYYAEAAWPISVLVLVQIKLG